MQLFIGGQFVDAASGKVRLRPSGLLIPLAVRFTTRQQLAHDLPRRAPCCCPSLPPLLRPSAASARLQTFGVVDPRTGEEVFHVAEADKADVDK